MIFPAKSIIVSRFVNFTLTLLQKYLLICHFYLHDIFSAEAVRATRIYGRRNRSSDWHEEPYIVSGIHHSNKGVSLSEKATGDLTWKKLVCIQWHLNQWQLWPNIEKRPLIQISLIILQHLKLRHSNSILCGFMRPPKVII